MVRGSSGNSAKGKPNQMHKFMIGPIEILDKRITRARDRAINKLEVSPLPIPGPPVGDILAIVITPRWTEWRIQYVFPDRCLVHSGAGGQSVENIRKEAVEFAAHYDLCRGTGEHALVKIADWAAKHAHFSALEKQRFLAGVKERVLVAEATHELKQVTLSNGEKLTPSQIHQVVHGAPGISGELMDLHNVFIKRKGIA